MTKSIIIALLQSSCVFICSFFFPSISAIAQVTTDQTTSTTVTSSDSKNFTISNGDRAGGNLFHSFQDFSVPSNGSAFFNNSLDVVNIFSRVTGGKISNIDGLIRANGSANLFLINPAGIIFGSNARLDIGGSFLGSTADSLLFPEGEFRATDLDNPPLLTINAPIGLGFRDNPGNIVNQSVTNNSNGLEVSVGKSITLVGGDIELAGGNIFAPSGRVELGGLSTTGEIVISTDGNLVFSDDIQRANVSLTNAANVNVEGAGGGSIVVHASNIELSGKSGGGILRAGIAPDSGFINAQASDIILNATETIRVSQESGILNLVAPTGVGNSGEINITTRDLILTEGGAVSTSTFGQGDAGLITINASGLISADGESQAGFISGIFSTVEQFGVGNSAGIKISTTDLTLTNGGEINSNTFGQGDAGLITVNASGLISADGQSQDGFVSGIFSAVSPTGRGTTGGIKIATNNLALSNGGRISASTLGQGNAGTITINASDTISVAGESPFGFISGIASLVGESGVGDAGGIKITTNNLALSNGGRISASTLGQGNAGTITINASDTISVAGESPFGFISGIASLVGESGVGNAGGIKITTTNLSLTKGGAINASTFGTGNAGTIIIKTSDTISAAGESPSGFSSSIFSGVGESGIGNAGGIKITTANLSLTKGGAISASTFGQGNAGVINIGASDTIFIDSDFREFFGGIYSRVTPTGVGNAGGIKIATRNLSLVNNAIVTVQSGLQGNAGEISIQAQSLLLANRSSLAASTSMGTGGSIALQIDDNLVLKKNSTISAQATGNANGGNINIDANFLIASPDQNNDIIASSEGGMGGNIMIAAEGIFGLKERSAIPANTTNDIDASSEFGLNGDVLINTPDASLIEENIEVPEFIQLQILDAIACSYEKETKANSFTIAGKGGTPPQITAPLNSDTIFVEGKSTTIITEQINRAERRQVTPLITAQGAIYPARGIVFRDNGDIVLTAYPNNIVQRTPHISSNCRRS